MNHDPGCKVHEARTAVWFSVNEGRNLKRLVAKPKRITHLQIQHLKQRRIYPGLARLRYFAGGLGGIVFRQIWLDGVTALQIQQAHLPAQGIPFGHRFQGHQFGFATLGIVCARHAGKTQGGIGFEPQGLGLLLEVGGSGFVAHHHGIATQELASIAPQTSLQPV